MYYAKAVAGKPDEGKIQERRGFGSTHPPSGQVLYGPSFSDTRLSCQPSASPFCFCLFFFKLNFLWFGLFVKYEASWPVPEACCEDFRWDVGAWPSAVPHSWTCARLEWVWVSLSLGSPHQPQQSGMATGPCCFWHTAGTYVDIRSQNLNFHWKSLGFPEYSWRLTLASWNYDQRREAASTTGRLCIPALNWSLWRQQCFLARLWQAGTSLQCYL